MKLPTNSLILNPASRLFHNHSSSPSLLSFPMTVLPLPPYILTLSLASPMSSNQPDPPKLMTDNQLDHELDIFITQQQHLHNTTIALTTHQLTQFTSTSESLKPPTRAHRVFKRKQPNPISQFLISHPRYSRLYALHQRNKANVYILPTNQNLRCWQNPPTNSPPRIYTAHWNHHTRIPSQHQLESQNV